MRQWQDETARPEVRVAGTRHPMELRLRWRPWIQYADAETPDGTLWLPATPDNAALLDILKEEGNWAHGPGTHWVEWRNA